MSIEIKQKIKEVADDFGNALLPQKPDLRLSESFMISPRAVRRI